MSKDDPPSSEATKSLEDEIKEKIRKKFMETKVTEKSEAKREEVFRENMKVFFDGKTMEEIVEEDIRANMPFAKVRKTEAETESRFEEVDDDEAEEVESELYSWQPVEGRGNGLVAKVDLQKGQMLLEEKVCFIFNPARDDTVAASDRIQNQVDVLSERKKEKFFALSDPEPEADPKLKALRIFKNVHVCNGLFLIAGRINHSCKPNALWSTVDSKLLELRALRDIKEGEEITVSYLNPAKFLTKDERFKLFENWKFQCACELCSLDASACEKNDKVCMMIRDNFAKIEAFLDDIQAKYPPKDMDVLSSNLKSTFKLAEANMEYAQSLETQAGGFVCWILGQLHLLSTLGSVFDISIDRAETPEAYEKKARTTAELLGSVFVTGCDGNEAVSRSYVVHGKKD